MRFRFESTEVYEQCVELRTSVRSFLSEEQDAGRFSPRPNSWTHYVSAFTRRCGERGFIGIGMSEPGAGFDLAAVRTKGIRTEVGWHVTGSKLWTSNAHRAQYIMALIRTGESTAGKHAGLTQLIVDMQSDGLSVSPIEDITGGRDFNEIALDRVFVPDDHFTAAVAKSRASEAVGPVTEIAHQIVGAMGFTVEFPLHHVTRRLWAWRDEDGSELYWNRRIGAMVSAERGRGLWPLLSETAPSGRGWQR